MTTPRSRPDIDALSATVAALDKKFSMHDKIEVTWRSDLDARLDKLEGRDELHHSQIMTNTDLLQKNTEALNLIGANTVAIKELLDGHTVRKAIIAFCMWGALVFGGIATGAAAIASLFFHHK